jgi:UDP:flavonoid glycosyltransferase YjiC (YdhE family)
VKRVLFAWQLGANYGHLGQDLPVAEGLRALGYEVSFVLPDLRLAAERLGPRGFSYAMAPLPIGALNPPYPPGNFAEILLATGFADELTCFGLVEGWLHLFSLIQPDILVLDYAPMALLAARAAAVPALMLSTGFDVPPATSPLPSIRPTESIPPQRLMAADALVLKRVNAVLAIRGQPPCLALSDLFAAVPTLFTTFAELDHYGARLQAQYIGPILSTVPGSPIHWSADEARRRFFAYLRPTVPGVEALLNALAESGASVVCAMPGAPDAVCKRYASATLQLLPRAVALEPLMRTADVVVSYGGSATTAAALLAGAPLLIAPQMVEQELIGRRVEELGAGIVIKGARSKELFARTLSRLIEEGSYRAAARAFAAKYADHDTPQAVGHVTRLIAKMGSTVTPSDHLPPEAAGTRKIPG